MKKTIKLKLLASILPALMLLTVASCKKDKKVTPEVKIPGKYDNGFFIINAGWYSHGTGSVSFFSYDTNTITDSIFTKENPGKGFDPATSSMEYGTVYNGKLYMLTNVGGPIVVADASTLKQTGRIDSASTNDFRAFVGIDDTKGLVSSGDGVYPLNLQSVTLGAKLNGISGEVGDMVKAGNYIFILSASDGVDVLSAADYSIVKTIPDMVVGFAVTPDGSVWAAGNKTLVKINSSSLTVSSTALPFDINGTFGFWHPGSITASTKDNTIFIGNNGAYTGATTIYRYKDGDASTLTAPFINIAGGKELIGKGLVYNASKDQLIVSTVESGYGTHYLVNDLDFYDVSTGSLIKDLPFSGYYFPATYAFH